MPRAFSPDDGRRINLPRPPDPSTIRPELPRPPVSPRPSTDLRARKDEIVRPAQRLIPVQPPGPPSQVRPAAQAPPQAPPAPAMQPGGLREETPVAPPRALSPAPTPPRPVKASPLGPDRSPVERFLAAPDAQRLPPGAQAHLRDIGIPSEGGLSDEEVARREQIAVRDFQRFGRYSGDDDPNAPPPPIRPGRWSYNPTTGQWIRPEREVSVLDRLARTLRG